MLERGGGLVVAATDSAYSHCKAFLQQLPGPADIGSDSIGRRMLAMRYPLLGCNTARRGKRM